MPIGPLIAADIIDINDYTNKSGEFLYFSTCPKANRTEKSNERRRNCKFLRIESKFRRKIASL